MEKTTRNTYLAPGLRTLELRAEYTFLVSGADEAGSDYNPWNDLGELA